MMIIFSGKGAFHNRSATIHTNHRIHTWEQKLAHHMNANLIRYADGAKTNVFDGEK